MIQRAEIYITNENSEQPAWTNRFVVMVHEHLMAKTNFITYNTFKTAEKHAN